VPLIVTPGVSSTSELKSAVGGATFSIRLRPTTDCGCVVVSEDVMIASSAALVPVTMMSAVESASASFA